MNNNIILQQQTHALMHNAQGHLRLQAKINNINNKNNNVTFYAFIVNLD